MSITETTFATRCLLPIAHGGLEEVSRLQKWAVRVGSGRSCLVNSVGHEPQPIAVYRINPRLENSNDEIIARSWACRGVF